MNEVQMFSYVYLQANCEMNEVQMFSYVYLQANHEMNEVTCITNCVFAGELRDERGANVQLRV